MKNTDLPITRLEQLTNKEQSEEWHKTLQTVSEETLSYYRFFPLTKLQQKLSGVLSQTENNRPSGLMWVRSPQTENPGCRHTVRNRPAVLVWGCERGIKVFWWSSLAEGILLSGGTALNSLTSPHPVPLCPSFIDVQVVNISAWLQSVSERAVWEEPSCHTFSVHT